MVRSLIIAAPGLESLTINLRRQFWKAAHLEVDQALKQFHFLPQNLSKQARGTSESPEDRPGKTRQPFKTTTKRRRFQGNKKPAQLGPDAHQPKGTGHQQHQNEKNEDRQ